MCAPPFASLECRAPDATRRHAVTVLCDPGQAKSAPWIALAVKAHQCESAAPWLRKLCGRQSTLVVAQNGVEHIERTEHHANGATVVPAVVYLPAEKLSAGVIRQSALGQLVVPESAAGASFEALFSKDVPVTVRQSDQFASVSWQKLMINAATGAVGALTQRKNEVMFDEEVRELAIQLMTEVIAVARAIKVEIPDRAIDRAFERIRGAADHYSSITQDRIAGRPLEWEARNGVVGRIGRRVGVSTPVNDALTALLRACDGARES